MNLMQKLKEFILRNKIILLIVLFLLVGYWWGSRQSSPVPVLRSPLTQTASERFDTTGEIEKATAPDLTQTNVTGEEEVSSPSERLIIKTANLSLLVKNVRESVSKIHDLAKSMNGFITNSSISEVGEKEGQLRATVTLRVPAEKFDETLTILKNAAIKVKSENVTGQDVTEEYTDLQSCLTNLEATEQQLLQIMKRAGEIKDVLEVQRELNNVRGQIEQTKGRIKYLEQSAKLSSITVYLATVEEELPIVEEQWKPLAAAKEGLRSLISFWQGITNRVIYWGIFLSPFVTIGLFILFLKKLRPRKPQTTTERI